MKTRKILESSFVAMLLVCFASEGAWAAQSASVLLQEGIYAEEIEGDLDSAIKIYEKIIVQAEQTEQAAAMAMYRIGMCRLKKGDKSQAAMQFEQIIEKFPAQKSLVAKASEQLAKLQPASAGVFRPVVDSSNEGQTYFYDFDKEKAFPCPEWLTRNSPPKEVLAWGRKNGIDFIIDDRGEIELADAIAVKVAYGLWDSGGPVEINAALEKGPHETTSLRASDEGHETSAPITYVFETREGGLGMLQILGKKGDNVRIRYKMLRDSTAANLYEHVPGEVLGRIAGKYGSISAEAGAKGLYSNSHIYFVQADMTLETGGMGYYRNSSNRPAGGRIRLSGTSDADQSLYDVAGRKMDIDIVADSVRERFYHIYWTPSEPVPPGQMFYYGWSSDDARKLERVAGGEGHKLRMQNEFGQKVVETFFLVVPGGTEIVDKSEDYTAKDTVGDFDVYYWSKEVPENTNNVVDVTLVGPVLSAAKEVTLPIILHSRADIDLDIEPEKYVAFDFERGMTFNVARIIDKKAPEGGMDLALKSGIDVIAVMSPNSAGLLGVATIFEKLDRKTWESVAPGDLSIVGDKQWRIDREQEIPAADGQASHPVYAFKTAQGGMGIVQLRQIDKVNRTVKFRYSMLSGGSQDRRTRQPREDSTRLLKEIGLAMVMYANEHEDKFPASQEQLREFMEIAKQGDTQWMTANVTYLAAGKSGGAAQPNLVAAAYDKTLLQRDSGTNVLFLDGHVEFLAAGEIDTPGVVAEIVRKAVLTISTCTESDPRVAESLKSLKPLNSGPTVKELCKYLDSDKATVRRSAIFILWRGGFDDVTAAEGTLVKLCNHEESLTRGMSLLALGECKAAAGYDILADKTLNDSDGYVRRCAAYALGLYGDKKALPVLEKALQDKDPLVQGNAQTAITMLTELKDAGQK